MNRKRLWLVVLLAILLLAACSGGNNGGGSGGKEQSAAPSENNAQTQTPVNNAPQEIKEEPKPPTEISILSMYSSPNPPSADGETMKKLQELSNTKLTINWVPQTRIMKSLRH
jgi:ABC-type glycerol-3-phosphate transport system substrate-binding protein